MQLHQVGRNEEALELLWRKSNC
ncbi:hypothetical protein [Enterobacter hormaechei]